MTEPTTPATATEAQSALNLKIADPEWGARFLQGDVAARKEYDDLMGRVATGGDDVVAAVMNGTVPASDHVAAPSDIREMSVVTDLFRDTGVDEKITANFLRGEQVTPDEFKRVANWKRSAMNDPTFTKAFLAGDQQARQKMLIADSVLTNGIKENAA